MKISSKLYFFFFIAIINLWTIEAFAITSIVFPEFPPYMMLKTPVQPEGLFYEILEKIRLETLPNIKVEIVPILRLKDTIEHNTKDNIYVLTYKMSGKRLIDENVKNYCGKSFGVLETGFIQKLPAKNKIKNVSDIQEDQILTSAQHSEYLKKIFPNVHLNTKLISHSTQLVTMLEKGRFHFAYDNLYRFEMNYKRLKKTFKYHILKIGVTEVTLCTNNPKLNNLVDKIVDEILKLRGSKFIQSLEKKYDATYPWPKL